MSIRTKIIFAFSVLLGLMASQLIITITQVGRIADISSHVAGAGLTSLTRLQDIELSLLELRLAAQSALLHEDFTPLAASEQLLSSLTSSWPANTLPLEEVAAWQARLSAYLESHTVLTASLASGDLTAAREIFTATQPQFEALLNATRSLAARELAANRHLGNLTTELASQTRHLFTAGLIIATLVEIGIGWYLMRSLTTSLARLVEGTRRVASGDLTQEVYLDTQDEFSYLARSFNAMLKSLRDTQVENARLHLQTVEMQQEQIRLLREQFSRIVKAQEDERQRVARELHDQAGQALTAIQLGLGRLEKLEDPVAAKGEAQALRELTVQTMEEIRNLAVDLRPSILDDLGLVPAVRQYVREFGRRTGLSTTFIADPINKRFPAEMEAALFRVIQEALTNTAKHAAATQVSVEMKGQPEELQITVADDGRGFDLREVLRGDNKRSLGLFGMQERMSLVGGKLTIESTPGAGTRLTAVAPWSAYPDGRQTEPPRLLST